MKLNVYKNYRVCPICQQSIPLTRVYFKRYGDTGYHKVCRSCEEKLDIEHEWKDGLLLCHDCLQYKNEDCFTSNATTCKTRNNRRHICNSCAAERQRKHDINLPDDKKLKKCLRFRWLGARDRAAKHDIQFNLTLDYIIQLWEEQKGICSLSGIPMTFELKKGRTFTNVSIDRIDQNKGYIIGNVQLVCMACNQIKSDLSEDSMYFFCRKIVEQYESKNKKDTTAA